MANFRFRAWQYTDTVPLVDRQVDMEVWYNNETNTLSFQINSEPYPRPADKYYAGGWFTLDEDATILWMNRFSRIDFAKWDSDYLDMNYTGWSYYVGFYSDGDESEMAAETRISGLTPPQWDEFISLMEILYPVHGDREFTWPAGEKYPAEEKKKWDEFVKQQYSHWLNPEDEQEFEAEALLDPVYLPDDWEL